LWILPTIVITPLIFWWNRKILGVNKANLCKNQSVFTAPDCWQKNEIIIRYCR